MQHCGNASKSLCVCVWRGEGVLWVCIVGWMPCTPVALFSHCCFTLIFCQCNMRTKATTACSFCCCYAVTHTDKIEKAELVQERDREIESLAQLQRPKSANRSRKRFSARDSSSGAQSGIGCVSGPKDFAPRNLDMQRHQVVLWLNLWFCL